MDIDLEPSKPVSSTDMEVDQPPPRPPSTSNSRSSRAQSVPHCHPGYTVGLVYSSDMLAHFHPDGHDEQPARISRIWDLFVQNKLTQRAHFVPIRKVEKHEALLVHTEDHWNKVLALKHITDQQRIDSERFYDQLSVYVMSGTTDAARLSCGGVIESTLAVAQGRLKKTFAIVRPPGHHAEPDEHMGFCFFNNVAVAARVAQQMSKIKKILILDWDVHHGNGTQRAFYDDPSVLYISLHRYDGGAFYPCGPFGGLQSCGEGPGLGYSVNIPWPMHGMGDADYIHAFQKIVMPIAMEFAPELVMISAGFDAAKGDPLGECLLSPTGYAHMTHMLSGLANGRLVVALEGGYHVESSAQSALAVGRVLLGEAPPEMAPAIASETATETVWLVAKEQSQYWKSIDVKSCEPVEEMLPIAHSIPEILKLHRQHYLATNYDMLQVPMLTEELEERFGSQVFCSPDLFDARTLVVLVHEFGNIRAELADSATCNLHVQKSYLLDITKQIIGWIHTEKYALLDINLSPKPFGSPLKAPKSVDNVAREIMVYLWDNYIQLARPQRIVFIGHGPGCKPIIHLLRQRSTGFMRDVKLIVQVIGQGDPPRAPADDELKLWYSKHSAVFLPNSHHILGEKGQMKESKKHGQVCAIDETMPMKVMIRAFEAIKVVVGEALNRSPLQDKRTN